MTPRILSRRSVLPVIVAVSFGCLLSLPWEQDVFKVMQRDNTRLPEWDSLETDLFKRESFKFTSQGSQCDAWLYLPTATVLRGNTSRLVILALRAILIPGIHNEGMIRGLHSPYRLQGCPWLASRVDDVLAYTQPLQ
jgi:hypothetical protein